jgi:Putative prokaryotic signal transducing protein
MYCPECGREYREGYDTCSECEVPLTASPPVEPEPVHPDIELVTVLEGSDPAAIALAESLLLEENIPYLKKFDQIQDLFAMGRLMGFNPAVGPVVIQVPEEHAEQALEVLGDLRHGNLEPGGDALESMET